MKNLVIFSGAGISAESGLKTFRDEDGLWEEYNIMDVATPEAWEKNPELVLEFYNKRRRQILEAEPNPGHHALSKLQQKFNVQVITQNIDNLHERAASENVLHLHGDITKCRSVNDPDKHYHIGDRELKWGDLADDGHQLRPHVVWFEEDVPNFKLAQQIVSESEILIIVGTSLNVYPAAGLIRFASYKCKKYLVDPNDIHITDVENLKFIKEKSSTALPMLVEELLNG
jgi:NAD-dependent deacetylase